MHFTTEHMCAFKSFTFHLLIFVIFKPMLQQVASSAQGIRREAESTILKVWCKDRWAKLETISCQLKILLQSLGCASYGTCSWLEKLLIVASHSSRPWVPSVATMGAIGPINTFTGSGLVILKSGRGQVGYLPSRASNGPLEIWLLCRLK